jgi:hypothetical protein
MVTRFTSDLWKLAQDGGMTMIESPSYSNWNNVSKALTAFAMQKYYDETPQSAGYKKELFTDLSTIGEGSNGIRFDTAAVVGAGNSIVTAKGYTQYFQNYLDTTSLLSSQERLTIQYLLPRMRDWYVQAGANGMTASDTLNLGGFMLGGSGADTLEGGSGNDLLVGNASNDKLVGGAGHGVMNYDITALGVEISTLARVNLSISARAATIAELWRVVA